MKSLSTWIVYLAVMAAAPGCGDGGPEGGAGQSLRCGNIPTCYRDALIALQECVPDPALALGTPMPMSGVVEGLTCESGEVTVEFSAFSERPTGTVPVPSNVTILSGGSLCAELGSGTGTSTDGSGNVIAFELSNLRTPDAEIAVRRYEDGAISVNCSPPRATEELVASPGNLDDCPGEVLFHEVVRDDEITHMGVELLDAVDTRTPLFSCD